MADETTDMAERAELSIFIRYIDSDSHKVKEEFLGAAEVVGSKGKEALFKLIFEVLQNKEVDINQMQFNGFDGTSTMGGEISGLQCQFCNLVPLSKYINCRNNRLALVFVRLLPKYKTLMDVDAIIISV